MHEEIKDEGVICKEGVKSCKKYTYNHEPEWRRSKTDGPSSPCQGCWTAGWIGTQFLNNKNDLELGGVLVTVLSHLSWGEWYWRLLTQCNIFFSLEILKLHYFRYMHIVYFLIWYINNEIQFTTKRIFRINTEHIAGVHLSLSSFSRSLTKIFLGSGSKLWLGWSERKWKWSWQSWNCLPSAVSAFCLLFWRSEKSLML